MKPGKLPYILLLNLIRISMKFDINEIPASSFMYKMKFSVKFNSC